MSSHNLSELSESQAKMITDRIIQTEKDINGLVEGLAACNRKSSRTRDKTDELAKIIKTLSDSESHNESMGSALNEFSKSIVHLADIEDTKITRIEEKIIAELVQYEYLCRNTREEVKGLIAARDREMAKRRSIELNKRARGHGTSENEIMLSNIHLAKILKDLTGAAENFEKQKLGDMKDVLMNFVLIQLKYFTSGVEIFSNVYEAISNVDNKADLEHFTGEVRKINRQFKKHLEQENKTSNKFNFMRAFNVFSHSTSNLDRIGKFEKVTAKAARSQSTMSLNSIDSTESEARAEKEEPQTTSANADESDSDIDDSELDQSDTITEETSVANQQPSSKNTISLTRSKHAK